MLDSRVTLLLIALGISGISGQLSFSESQYTGSVDENAFPSDVTTVECTDSEGNSNDVQYSIPNGIPFSIGTTSGVISVATALDYETTTQYDFGVTCSNQSSSANATVSVAVLPVNEERPEPVGSQVLSVFIDENTEPGTVLVSTQPGALLRYEVSDSDTGPGNAIYYTLNRVEPPQYSQNFVFDNSTGAVILNSTIDLDSPSQGLDLFIVFTIVVCDLQPADSTCPNFELTVFYMRLNDEMPTITAPQLTATVAENASINTTLVQFFCSDRDIGPGSVTIEEVYISDPPEASNGTFQVLRNDSQSRLVVAMPLNREDVESYTAVVSCSDGEFETAVSILVTVTDVNDNSPFFTQSFSQPVLVSESSGVATVALEVECMDADFGVNSDIDYSLNPLDLFEIANASNGEVSVRTSLTLPPLLNYMDHTITIVCQDNGFPSLSNEANITIRIFKPDDIAPTFISDSEIFAREDFQIGAIVATLTATDPDSIGVSYSLSPQSSVFKLNESSGELTLVESLDREEVSSYTLTVQAVEERIAPGTPQTSTVEITISVSDINDNDPFCADVESISLDSASYVDFTVATLDCSDRDSGINQELSYSFDESTLPILADGRLTLNQMTGGLVLNGRFPRQLELYLIRIFISDRGSPATRTAEVTVVIRVIPLQVEAYIIAVPIVVIVLFLCLLVLLLALCCFCCRRRRRRGNTTYALRPQGSGRKKEGPLDAIKITEKYPALRKEGEHTAIEMLQPNSPTEDAEENRSPTDSLPPQVTVEVDDVRDPTPEKQDLVIENPASESGQTAASPHSQDNHSEDGGSLSSEQEFRLTFETQDDKEQPDKDEEDDEDTNPSADKVEGHDSDTNLGSQSRLIGDDYDAAAGEVVSSTAEVVHPAPASSTGTPPTGVADSKV